MTLREQIADVVGEYGNAVMEDRSVLVSAEDSIDAADRITLEDAT